jgi:MinD-like ATPase involved in chromosome partitioning or flagellar assembly/CheY-like chemotaxis protein
MSGQRVRVLLLEGNPADARTVRQLLWEAESDSFEVVWLDRLGAGLKHLEDNGAEVLLLDLALADSTASNTFAALRRGALKTPVVVLAGDDEEKLALQAVSEGAHDYLLKRQLSGGALMRAIESALKRSHAPSGGPAETPGGRNGVVLGFAGAKGGVGSTTLALNVATVLARGRRRVIAVELEPGCAGFALQLHQTPGAEPGSLLSLDAARIDRRELNSRLAETPFGVHVLFGPAGAAGVGTIRPEQAEALFQAARQLADCVVVDLPPLSSPAAPIAVPHCDHLVLIVDREVACMAASAMAAELLRSWTRGQSELRAVIVNRTSMASLTSLSDVRSQVKCEVVGVIPHDIERSASACQTGVPLVVSHPDSITADALVELGKRLNLHPATAGAVVL